MREIEREIFSSETSQSDTPHVDNGVMRFAVYSTRLAQLIAKTIKAFLYRTYQGFGIIMWVSVIGLTPYGFLWLITSLPFPLSTALAFGVAFGFVCVSRSRWRSK